MRFRPTAMLGRRYLQKLFTNPEDGRMITIKTTTEHEEQYYEFA